MQALLFAVVFGLAGGIAVGLQGPLTSMMSRHIGVMESVFIIHLGGLLLAGFLLFFFWSGQLGAWREVPWYALGAGMLGVVVLTAVSYTIPRIGVTATVSLIVAAQLVLGVVLDQFGWLGADIRPIDIGRLVGIVVLFLGTWLIIR